MKTFTLIILLLCLTGITATFALVHRTEYRNKVPNGEYQIILEPDSAYIYDNGKFIGACPHGKDGIDSIILLDNL